jgi:hypothetical protein
VGLLVSGAASGISGGIVERGIETGSVSKTLSPKAIAVDAALGAGSAVAAKAAAVVAPKVAGAVKSALARGRASGAAVRSSTRAAQSALASIPRITPGQNREMLGQAMRYVKECQGSAAQKADLFEKLASQVNELSHGNWSATRGMGTDGSHIFLGGRGDALIIDSKGALFRGSWNEAVTIMSKPGEFTGEFTVDYSKAREVK